MKYVYHYHATFHDTDKHVDGLLTTAEPLATMDMYSQAKRDIAHTFGQSPARMTICSLALLHTPED
jgi:hypothetical protein